MLHFSPLVQCHRVRNFCDDDPGRRVGIYCHLCRYTDKVLWLHCKVQNQTDIKSAVKQEKVEKKSVHDIDLERMSSIYCLHTPQKMTHTTWGIKRNLITSAAALSYRSIHKLVHRRFKFFLFIYFWNLFFLVLSYLCRGVRVFTYADIYIIYAWLNGYLVENKKRRSNFRPTNGRYRGGI